MYQHIGAIKLKTAPEILALVRAASPSYKKHDAILIVCDRVELQGTYWDGGSRSTYSAVNILTRRCSGAPQYDPPQFGGPKTDPVVGLPPGAVIVKTGTFCGRTAAATVYIHPDNAAKLLPAPAAA